MTKIQNRFFLFSLIVIVSLLLGTKTALTQKPAPQGYWAVHAQDIHPEFKNEVRNGVRIEAAYPEAAFRLSGSGITLFLHFDSELAKGHSDDSIYLLKTKWIKQDLYFLSPNGQWSEFAHYENGKFSRQVDNKIWTYQPVKAEELSSPRYQLLKKKRQLFPY